VFEKNLCAPQFEFCIKLPLTVLVLTATTFIKQRKLEEETPPAFLWSDEE